jgi:hypothetical protein
MGQKTLHHWNWGETGTEIGRRVRRERNSFRLRNSGGDYRSATASWISSAHLIEN